MTTNYYGGREGSDRQTGPARKLLLATEQQNCI